MSAEVLALNHPIVLPRQDNLRANFDKVHITSSGAEVLRERADLSEQFGQAALELFSRENTEEWRERQLGAGYFGTAYYLPDSPDMCIKVVTPFTSRQGYRWQELSNIRPTNLITDLKLMDGLQRRLARRPEHGVLAPRHFVGVSKHTDMRRYALLQERIPADYVAMASILRDDEGKPREPYDELEEYKAAVTTLKHRFFRAIGASPLRYMVNDFTCGKVGRERYILNAKNIWVKPDQPLSETPVCVIDMLRLTMGRKLTHQALRFKRSATVF